MLTASIVRTSRASKMQPQNKKRFESLSALAPVDAVRAWLDGDFGMGDEPALISAIRKDTRISLTDDDLTDAILDAMDNGLDAPACLERLAIPRN
jgi:hypothetical protein